MSRTLLYELWSLYTIYCLLLVKVNNLSRWSTVFIRMKLNTLQPISTAMKQIKDIYEK